MARGARFVELVQIMDTLRTDCPWDARQTHRSLAEYLVEETYEAIEAIEGDDSPALREEIGDLLLQIVFHARIAQETGAWDIDAVVDGIITKLVHRHPHVFAGEPVGTPTQMEDLWHARKVEEKGRSGLTEGIPVSLPALLRAGKVLARSRGLDLGEPPGAAGARALVADLAAERDFGDLLFALVAAGRDRGWEAEAALRGAVRERTEGVAGRRAVSEGTG